MRENREIVAGLAVVVDVAETLEAGEVGDERAQQRGIGKTAVRERRRSKRPDAGEELEDRRLRTEQRGVGGILSRAGVEAGRRQWIDDSSGGLRVERSGGAGQATGSDIGCRTREIERGQAVGVAGIVVPETQAVLTA